jgi:hypothetical protein
MAELVSEANILAEQAERFLQQLTTDLADAEKFTSGGTGF